MLPPIYLSNDPADELKSYVGDYLQEEIRAEALSRNIEGFSRFLHRTALSSGEVINFESIASDAQVPARTVREYYTVLQDTLIGVMLPSFKTSKRKSISKGKFYFFDVGVMNALIGITSLHAGTSAYGTAFEHLVFQELYAYLSYKGLNQALTFWRSVTHQEVDFVIAGEVAIEVKASSNIHQRDCDGLLNLSEDTPMKRRIVVCMEPDKRQIDSVEVYPYRRFLAELWHGQVH